MNSFLVALALVACASAVPTPGAFYGSPVLAGRAHAAGGLASFIEAFPGAFRMRAGDIPTASIIDVSESPVDADFARDLCAVPAECAFPGAATKAMCAVPAECVFRGAAAAPAVHRLASPSSGLIAVPAFRGAARWAAIPSAMSTKAIYNEDAEAAAEAAEAAIEASMAVKGLHAVPAAARWAAAKGLYAIPESMATKNLFSAVPAAAPWAAAKGLYAIPESMATKSLFSAVPAAAPWAAAKGLYAIPESMTTKGLFSAVPAAAPWSAAKGLYAIPESMATKTLFAVPSVSTRGLFGASAAAKGLHAVPTHSGVFAAEGAFPAKGLFVAPSAAAASGYEMDASAAAFDY